MTEHLPTELRDPKIRFDNLRRTIDQRYTDLMFRVWDDLASETPEVRSLATQWLDDRAPGVVDIRHMVLSDALARARNAEMVKGCPSNENDSGRQLEPDPCGVRA